MSETSIAPAKQRRSVREFLVKYFCQGSQSKNVSYVEELHEDADFLQRFVACHRKCVGILLPLGLFHIVYWCMFIRYGLYEVAKRRFYVMLVLIPGGFIGGATTVGGAAVVYPVMTLGFNISSSVARDLSLMSQATGLSCASFAIFFMGVPVEWRSLIFSSIGAVPGLILSLHYIDPLLNNAQKKMIFVSYFFAFALALYFLNRKKKRTTFDRIPSFTVFTSVILFAAGLIGGAFTAIAGSGINIFAFSVLTLLFRISEKVATPTAVVLMAGNSIMAFFWRAAMMGDIETETWEYFYVSCIVGATFAPLGSLFASMVHRQTLAVLVYVLQSVTLVSALLILPLTGTLVALTVLLLTQALGYLFQIGVIVVAFGFYWLMSKFGDRYVEEKPSTATLPVIS